VVEFQLTLSMALLIEGFFVRPVQKYVLLMYYLNFQLKYIFTQRQFVALRPHQRL